MNPERFLADVLSAPMRLERVLDAYSGHGSPLAAVGTVGIERVLHRGKWRSVEILACPVTWRPQPEQIASARRGYEDWRHALDWVRDGLIAGGMLREVEMTDAMPKLRPWLVSPRK